MRQKTERRDSQAHGGFVEGKWGKEVEKEGIERQFGTRGLLTTKEPDPKTRQGSTDVSETWMSQVTKCFLENESTTNRGGKKREKRSKNWFG